MNDTDLIYFDWVCDRCGYRGKGIQHIICPKCDKISDYEMRVETAITCLQYCVALLQESIDVKRNEINELESKRDKANRDMLKLKREFEYSE